jgi:hypothetical protein
MAQAGPATPTTTGHKRARHDPDDASQPTAAPLTLDPPTDISGILSAFGVPAGAIGIAYGLVRGAGALEKDAREEALQDVSRLLTSDSWANIGKLGITLVPAIFDRVFGSRPFSFKFISRSIVASVLAWIVLLLAKHADFNNALNGITDPGRLILIAIVLTTYFAVDWGSLAKARIIINVMRNKTSIMSYVLLVLIDMFLSYLVFVSYVFIWLLVIFTAPTFVVVLGDESQSHLTAFLRSLAISIEMQPIYGYFLKNGASITLVDVIVPSTLMTSMWTLLLLVSILVAKILSPIDHLRRLTIWWFKDVETRPLTAIAKVAATLIIIGAALIKAVRWL